MLTLKSDTLYFLKEFISYVKTQFSKNDQVVRSNNRREFFNHDIDCMLKSLGIVHQSSCVNPPQQNVIVERKHRHLLEVARVLKFQVPYLRMC